MEVISNSIEDKLIDGLSYKLEPTASYNTERKPILSGRWCQVYMLLTQEQKSLS